MGCEQKSNFIGGDTLSLSTTLNSEGIPLGSHKVLLHAPTLDFRLGIGPALSSAVFFEGKLVNQQPYVYRGEFATLSDDLKCAESGTTTGPVLKGSTTSDFLYLGFADEVDAIYFHIASGDENDQTATMTVEYWNGSKWVTLSVTDNTINTGKTLAQSGTVTWTAVNNWQAAVPRTLEVAGGGFDGSRAFWVRLSWSATLGTATAVNRVWAYNTSGPAAGYYRTGEEVEIAVDANLASCITAYVAASTDTLQMTWYALRRPK